MTSNILCLMQRLLFMNKKKTEVMGLNNKSINRVIFILIFTMVFSVLLLQVNAAYADVGKWKRFEVSYSNTSWSGNPFDLEFTGTFTHTSSGRTITQFGFYAGNNIWKIYFMPDRTGGWTFTTLSTDADLNGKTGTFNCISSGLPGRLIPDGNRWKLEDTGKFDAPIMIPSRQWFKSTTNAGGVRDFIDWANDTVGARIIGTTLVYFRHNQDEIPYISGQEGDEFNIEVWDRLNEHYDYMRDKGMGHYIMFYSDDREDPDNYGITAQSQRELRLFRYTIARFSAYPIVIWDTGIDIKETRSESWVSWFVDWFNTNDPWQHPSSSRGPTAGFDNPPNALYHSNGLRDIPAHTNLVNEWSNKNVPTIFTDRWREYYSSGDFDTDKIRRAVWEVGLVGGTGVYVSGNENGGYLTDTYASDFIAAPYCGYASSFFRGEIQDFGKLDPHDELVNSGTDVVLSADPGNEYVAYLPSGGSVNIDLSAVSETINYKWYNPRTGQASSISSVNGGVSRSFTAQDSNDWVLHLSDASADADTLPPAPPTNLNLIVQ